MVIIAFRILLQMALVITGAVHHMYNEHGSIDIALGSVLHLLLSSLRTRFQAHPKLLDYCIARH